MKISVAWIQSRPGKDKLPAMRSLTTEYLERISRYISIEAHEPRNEAPDSDGGAL